MKVPLGRPPRRQVLARLSGLAAWAAGGAVGTVGMLGAGRAWGQGAAGAEPPPPAHPAMGPLRPPLPLADLRLLDENGQPFGLRARLLGRATALQLMFTGCSATCPVQGALFAAVAPRLDASAAQLLSLSIDPLGDSPAALKAWMARFGAHPAWRAAVPRVQDVDGLLDLLRGRARGADRHTAQVYLVDRQARLAWRTEEMPPAAQLVELLGQMARR